MPNHALLDEVGRLNNRKSELYSRISDHEKRIESLNKEIRDLLSEKESINASLKPLRSQEADLKSRNNELRRLIHSADDELRAQRQRFAEDTRKLAREATLSKSQVEIEQRKSAAELQNIRKDQERLTLERQSVELAIDASKKESTRLAVEAASLERQYKAFQKEQTDFSIEKNKWKSKGDDLLAQKEELLQELRDAKELSIGLRKSKEDLNAQVEAHKRLVAAFDQRLSQLEKREKNASAQADLNASEKAALEIQRKELERDQLRFKKLVREKDVDKELKELRKNN